MNAEDTIDIQGLIEKAKPLQIKLVAKEWIELEGSATRFTPDGLGYKAAEAILIGNGITDQYVRGRMIRHKQENRPMYDIVHELADKMTQLGIEPQEGAFSWFRSDWELPEERRAMRKANDSTRPFSTDEYDAQRRRENARQLPQDYRWIAAYPVTGSNEGYYIHIDLIWQVEAHKTPWGQAMRHMADRIEKLPYEATTYDSDRKLMEEARTAMYEQPTEFRKMLALAKTWQLDNACACAAVAATLLGA